MHPHIKKIILGTFIMALSTSDTEAFNNWAKKVDYSSANSQQQRDNSNRDNGSRNRQNKDDRDNNPSSSACSKKLQELEQQNRQLRGRITVLQRTLESYENDR